MRLILLAAAAMVQSVVPSGPPPVPPPVAASPQPPEATPAPQALPVLPALTLLNLELVDPVSTRTIKRGDRFAIRLAAPLDLPGISLPAGTPGYGEVVHAQKPGAAGRAGELIIAARCLDVNGTCLKLRSLKVAPPHATERTDLALAVGVAAGVVGFLISGGHRELAAGTPLTALTAENTPWPPPAATPQIQPGQQEPRP